MDSSTFSQNPSFGRWVRESVGESLLTPSKGVSIVTSICTRLGSLQDDISTVKNLSKVFAEEGDTGGEVVTDLQILFIAADSQVPDVSLAPSWGKGLPSPKRMGGSATEPWPDCFVVQVGDVGVMNIPQAYNYLHIDNLLMAVPGREGRRDGAEFVVFFNEKGKELEDHFFSHSGLQAGTHSTRK